MKNILRTAIFFVYLWGSVPFLFAQESCYEQYFREHNKEIFPAIDENDDSYDELKKMALARQIMYNESVKERSKEERADQYAPSNGMFQPVLLAIDTVTGICHLLSEDGAVLATAHIALVDSTWYMWLSVDPLVDKNIANTPYMYCNGNPIMLIDPDGRDWYEAEDGSISWTDCKGQKEMNKQHISGIYLGEAVLVFNGYVDERFGTINGKGKYLGGENAKLANVTLYGPQGADDIVNDLVGFTMTSDYSKYGAIDNGKWPANYDSNGKSGAIQSHWTLNHRGYIPTYGCQPNMSPYAGEMFGTMYKNGIFIHSTLKPTNEVGSRTSTGCLLLDWNSMAIFNKKMVGVQNFMVIINRQK